MGKRIRKSVLVILLLILIGCVTLICYKHDFFRHKEVTTITKLGNLSVNYPDGNSIYSKDKLKKYSFSITNDSEEDIYYSIKVTNIKKIGKKATLILNDKTKIKLNNKEDVTILKGIKISSKETQNYTLTIDNPKQHLNAFQITISEEKEVEETITKTIIGNNTIKNNPATKPGEEISVNDEGLISDLDEDGITYYYRGNVVNNYFSFANKMWRIVRINGDNSIRLILDENVSVLTNFSDGKTEFGKSHISEVLNEWFEANLFEYQDYISSNKYCYDYNLTSDSKNFASFNRLTIAKITSFTCDTEALNLKIGLLSVDEAIYAGLAINSENKSSYLYNENINDWWLMTPAMDNENFSLFVVSNNGSIGYNNSSYDSKTLRPVINLSAYHKVTGTGTKDDPYIINE